MVLTPGQPYADQLRRATSDLLDTQPRWVGGVWVWDVRPLS